MKVDIITRHAVANYGSLLQSYATEKTFEKLGLDAEFINYVRYDERSKNLAKTQVKGKKWDKNIITRTMYTLIQTWNYSHEYKAFEKYRKGFIKETSNLYGSIEELTKNPPKADIYCTGSDQIWGKIGQADYDLAYFLEFVKDKNKKCISYAASFGKEKINQKLEEKLPKLLDKYSYILVREDSAKEIVKKAGIDNVEQVLDPTFLLTKEEWKSLANKKPKKSNYVLVYQLHNNKEFNKYAKEFAKKYNKKLLRITPSIYHIVRGGKLIYLPTQYEFLSYFNNADYILTDSFHATVFSIIFNKKFKNISPGETSTRITSILKLCGLEDRILKDFSDFESIEKDIDYDKVNEIIKREREKSINLLKQAIGKMENNITSIGIHKNCTGCRMCEQVCPKGAIEIKENEEGFMEPVINKEKCINCGICLKRCPQANKIEKNEPIKCYAAKNKNIDDLKKGSSGSIFKILAEHVIKDAGTVYGAAFNENMDLNTIRVENINEIEKLMGSKYVQCNTNNTFTLVKKDLEDGKKVLYAGTPCQIAGLKSYLNKEYDNLLTVDLICHGVPSPKLFRKYIKNLEKKNRSKVKQYYFKNKEKNGWGSNGKVIFNNGKEKYISSTLDQYYKAFLESKISREACYNCKYANTSRIGDITLGDYWGIQRQHPEFYTDLGVSAVLINTKKGLEAFNCIKNDIEYIESQIEKISKENMNLIRPVDRKKIRNDVYKDIDTMEFNEYAKKRLKIKKRPKDIVKNMVPYKIKKILKKVKN